MFMLPCEHLWPMSALRKISDHVYWMPPGPVLGFQGSFVEPRIVTRRCHFACQRNEGRLTAHGRPQNRWDFAWRNPRHRRNRPDHRLELLDRVDRRAHWTDRVRRVCERKVVLKFARTRRVAAE